MVIIGFTPDALFNEEASSILGLGIDNIVYVEMNSSNRINMR